MTTTISEIMKCNDNQAVANYLKSRLSGKDDLFLTQGYKAPSGYGSTVEYVCCTPEGGVVYRRVK